jgi:outer membrane protein assembly factor BamB
VPHRLLFVLAVFLPVLSLAQGGDWPQFRGPTGQGVVAPGRLPTAWSPTCNVVWKQDIPGRGWSSPVVQDGRIYLTTAVAVSGDHSLRAVALDAATGKVLWNVEVFRSGPGAGPVHGKNSHASPTPVVAGKKLFVHFGHQGTACLDLDGKVLWRKILRYAPVHGNGGSPIIVDDKLIFSVDGADKQFVVALDRDTGKERWRTDRRTEAIKKFSFSTPLLITVQGQKQIISPGSDNVCAYDPDTGKEIWRVKYEGYSVVPRPVYGHGLVFICTGYESPSLLAIRPDGKGDVTGTHVAWTLRRNVALTPSLLFHEDELYMVSDSGIASCLDARTGKVLWQQRLGGSYSASPILADGKIYFLSEDGVATIVKTGKTFERVARNSLGEQTLASYAVVDGALLIRTERHLYRIEQR